MRLIMLLSIFTFIIPFLLWSQPPLKETDQKTTSKKKETASSSSKKKKTEKIIDTEKQAYYVELWRISLETKNCSYGECLLVKKRDLREYEIFEGDIEGFIYTKGNTYTLQVRIYTNTKSEQVTTFRYVLDEVIATSDVRYQEK